MTRSSSCSPSNRCVARTRPRSSTRASASCVSTTPTRRCTGCARDAWERPCRSRAGVAGRHTSRAQSRDARPAAAPGAREAERRRRGRAPRGAPGTVVPLAIRRALVSARRLPARGHWSYGGTDHPYVAATHWIARGARPSEEDAIEHLVRRCLAAFGPVSLADIAKFGGQVPARIRPTLERLAPTLRRFSDEEGHVLYDLPRAPRPHADTIAPVRLLPRYDEILIAYQHRARVALEKHRAAVYAKNGIIEATLLVDGFVAGIWSLARTNDETVVRIAPFARLAAADRSAALEEGERLARFLAPEAARHGARIVSPGAAS